MKNILNVDIPEDVLRNFHKDIYDKINKMISIFPNKNPNVILIPIEYKEKIKERLEFFDILCGRYEDIKKYNHIVIYRTPYCDLKVYFVEDLKEIKIGYIDED